MKANFLIALAILTLSGCSSLWITDPEVEQSGSLSPSESFQSTVSDVPPDNSYPPPAPLSNVPDVEIIWAIPTTPVERYTIRYGFNRQELSESITIATSMLEKYEDPSHGFVYRYVLKGIPEHRTVFVSLVAQSSTETSAPSEVFEIPGR